jgi:addiction module HigA family antidote
MRTTTSDHDDRMKNPPHPGTFIRTEILEPLKLSVTAAAQVPGVSRVALSSLLNGQAKLSGDMALRIENAFGVRMETPMRMQSSYEPGNHGDRRLDQRLQRPLGGAEGRGPDGAGAASASFARCT